MKYLIVTIIALITSACGQAPEKTKICGIVYNQAYDGIIINPNDAKPLPFAYYKVLSDTQVLLETGSYTVQGTCFFRMKNGSPIVY